MRVFASPTLMDMYRQCKRCAYDQLVMKLKRPRGIYPTLPNGIDLALKAYTDKFRGSMPVELAHLDGHHIHPSQSLLNTLRPWNGIIATYEAMVDRPTQNNPNRRVSHTVVVTGGLDELLVNNTDQIVLIDFKTKATEPDDNYGDKYYKETMETYAWMLKKNGHDVADYCYLFYWFPLGVDVGGMMQFGTKVLTMQINADNVEPRLEAIAQSLPTINMEAMQYRPKAGHDCDYCKYIDEQEAHKDL